MELELLTSTLKELGYNRKDRRVIERDFKKGKINDQYSYTTREAIATFKDLRGNFDWIPSKEGQTIDQWWIVRINQQRCASNLTKAKPMGCFSVHGNDSVELDNNIRDFICDTKLHISVDFEDDGAGKEWILTRVDDIYKKLNFYPTCVDDIFNNKEFMELWYQRIEQSKKQYFEDKLRLSETYKLKQWQESWVQSMITSGKKKHVFGGSSRFGKTLSVLDAYKQKVLNGEYSKEELWLVPASKNLSSNTSFVNDYDDYGFNQYFNIVKNISLFIDDNKIIERLRKSLPINAKIVLITDEADVASHTDISIDKINLIIKEFDVVEQIVMTGTGIGKATKIFRGIPSNEINYHYCTYSEMIEMNDGAVKRHFLNIQYDIKKDFGDEKVLNIRQSVSDPNNHQQLSKYIGDLTINPIREKQLNLQPTEIVIVFIKPSKNKYLSQLVEVYQMMYSDKVKCLILTGMEGANNSTAEKKVKKTYNDMRKVGDMRKLIVFSAGIGSRSFSVGKIYREINFSDSELTSATIQEFARVYTYEEGKTVADVIRVGFTPMQLAEQLYLAENDIPDYSKKSYSTARMYLMNNTFASYDMFQNGSFKEEILGQNGIDDDIIGKFLDNVCKFSDSTKYYMTRWVGEGLVIDADPAKKSSKPQTKVLSTSIKSSTKLKSTTKNGKVKLTAEDERRLEQYVNIVRCIPSIANIVGMNTISEFLNSGYWKNYINIDQKLFEQNYNSSEEFKGGVDALFRQSVGKKVEEHKKRLINYMEFIS